MGRWMIADTYTLCLQFLELDDFGEHALGMNLLIYWTLDPPCGGAVQCVSTTLHVTSPQPTYHLVLGTGELRRFSGGLCIVFSDPGVGAVTGSFVTH